MTVAPAAIMKLSTTLKARADRPKSYVFLGIVGDVNHSFGYHLSKNDLPSSDYSLQLTRDKNGARQAPTYASAWDLGFNPVEMIAVTNRLLAAAKAKDPRIVNCVREFCGTTTGTHPHPYDVSRNFDDPNNTEGWDSSHDTHVHISFYRDVCNNYTALQGILDIICGDWDTMATEAEVAAVVKAEAGQAPWRNQVTGQNQTIAAGLTWSHNGITIIMAENEAYYGALAAGQTPAQAAQAAQKARATLLAQMAANAKNP